MTASPDSTHSDDTQPGHTPGELPPDEVWVRELRHLLGLKRDRTRRWPFERVLEACYVHNTPATQAQYRALPAVRLARLMHARYEAEKSLHTILNSLKAARRRVGMLHAFVLADRGVLEEELVQKEREALNLLREKIRATRQLLQRTASQAGNFQDRQYVQYQRPFLALADAYGEAADALALRQMRWLASCSRVNATYRKAVGAMAVGDPSASAFVAQAEAERAARMEMLGVEELWAMEPLVVQYTELAVGMQYFRDADVLRLEAEVGRELLPEMELKGKGPLGRVYVGGRALPSKRVLLDRMRRMEMYWPEGFGGGRVQRQQQGRAATAAWDKRDGGGDGDGGQQKQPA